MLRSTVAGLGLLIATGSAATAAAVGFGPDLAARGWDRLDFRGRPPAAFAATADTLSIRADSAVSLLWRPLPRDFANASAASWRWRVGAGVPPTDLARRGGDDRNIALYFLFANDPGSLDDDLPGSLTAALRRGRALVYVWGGARAGEVVSSPHMRGRGQLIVAEAAGGDGDWRTQSVDLRADFRRVFGREPGPLVGVAVSADSDDTGSLIEAALADLLIR
jgi:hypothetical protein